MSGSGKMIENPKRRLLAGFRPIAILLLVTLWKSTNTTRDTMLPEVGIRREANEMNRRVLRCTFLASAPC